MCSDDALQLFRVEQQQLADRQVAVAVREADDDAVVGRVYLPIEPVSLFDTCGDGHGPWFVHASAVWRVDDHTPIAFFILAAFDDQLTVVGNRSRGGALFGKQVGKIADGVAIQSVTT